MKAILTRANPDGSFDEVGTNNRILVSIATKEEIRQAAKEYAKNCLAVRIDYYKTNKGFNEVWGDTETIFFARN